MTKEIDYIKEQIYIANKKVNFLLKETASDCVVDAIGHLHQGNYKKAYHAVCQLYRLCGIPLKEAVTLFHTLLFAEDVVTRDSVIFIHEDSPYKKSLQNLAKELSFTVQEHHLSRSYWTKDYIISSGEKLIVPVKTKVNGYITQEFMIKAQSNYQLYYGPLNLSEHHHSKVTIKSFEQWRVSSRTLIDESSCTQKVIIEGGNLFCAINKYGERFCLVGANVLSETMAYNELTKKDALKLICKELNCLAKNLLIIPQWTYHLDLQMAYLGKGQFIIHSFKQEDIDFGLSPAEISKIKETFTFLESKFEENIIDCTIKVLKEHGFEVSKVFGCLFALDDVTQPEQQKYIPYCKGSEDCDGVYALMMNGIAFDLGAEGRHFAVARTDLITFKEQYEHSLKKLGITQIHDIDMLGAYDYDGIFNGIAVGIWGAMNVTQAVAFMNGALRCQTSILSKELSLVHNPGLFRHKFFKTKEFLDLKQSSLQSEMEPFTFDLP